MDQDCRHLRRTFEEKSCLLVDCQGFKSHFPIAPIFGIAARWQRVRVAASTIPFITLLAWRDAWTAHTN